MVFERRSSTKDHYGATKDYRLFFTITADLYDARTSQQLIFMNYQMESSKVFTESEIRLSPAKLFETLREAFMNPPILSLLQVSLPYKIDTDYSEHQSEFTLSNTRTVRESPFDICPKHLVR